MLPLSMSLFADDITFPIKNPAELHDIRIAQLDQLLRSLFTSATAAAVHHNELILVGQLGNLVSADGFVWHVDGIRDMPCGKLIVTITLSPFSKSAGSAQRSIADCAMAIFNICWLILFSPYILSIFVFEPFFIVSGLYFLQNSILSQQPSATDL